MSRSTNLRLSCFFLFSIAALLWFSRTCNGGSAGSQFSDPSWDDFKKNHDVKPLNQPVPVNTRELWAETFDENVSKGKWMVFFHAPWSAGSRRLLSIWDEFTFQCISQHPKVSFGRVNCEAEKKLCFDRLNITDFPHVVGIFKRRMVVMTEEESNDGLHSFISNGWYQRAPGKKIPPIPNPYYLKFMRVVQGLESIFKVPVQYLAYGAAAVTSMFVLFFCWLICFCCCCDRTISPEHLEKAVRAMGDEALLPTSETNSAKEDKTTSSTTPEPASGEADKSKPASASKLKRRKKPLVE